MVPILSYAYAILPKLETHLPTILASTAFFFALEFVSGKVSPIYSSSYRNHPKKTQIAWNSNVAALVHALVICPLAWRVSGAPAIVGDEVWGYTWEAGQVFAISCGFIWDTVFSYFNCPFDFLLHGIGGLALMVCSFRPFVGYYVSRFLLWELSTPFLNAHWFFEKTGRSGSLPMIINAICLITVFFTARIIYGSYLSYNFYKAMWINRSEIPFFLHFVFEGFNTAMTFLNLFWFKKMVNAFARRLKGEKKDTKRANGTNGTNGTTKKGKKDL
ncbi:TLC domain-containing protein [Mrakia frigida]|uniref:TLC domain-containing protein n=1 Tax=Mrakia frigida TaxID=29902 RepID=UPI003FCBF75D